MRPGEIHIWRAALPSTNAELGNRTSLLSSAELDRANRFTFERDRARFIGCRASLRLLLSRYIGAPPDKIVFRYEPQGKPALAGVGGWQFNVSHSRALAAIAISRYDSLGVDLELIDPLFPRDEVAPDILSTDELRDLASLPEADHAAGFFQLWTLKEALLKAVGGGFSLDPRDIRIRLDESMNPTIISAPPEFISASLHRFTIDPGFASALAVLAGVSNLSFFSL